MRTIESARKKLQSYAKKIDEHNEEIEEYIKETRSNLVPIIGSTMIGYDEIKPIKYTMFKNMMKVDVEGFITDVKIQKDEDEYYITGWEEYIDGVKQDIANNRKRIKAGYKVWYSANPDRELERVSEDTDED